jgi:hypothetical protein
VTDEIQVLVAHNISDDDRKWLRGYNPAHQLQHVFTYPAIEPELFANTPEGDKGVCEQAFYLFNAPEECMATRERNLARDYRGLGLRSLSVGDVVFVQRGDSLRGYACDAMGWQQLDNEPKLLPAVRA